MTSEMQEIIAHSAHKTFQQGVIRERERILNLIQEHNVINADQKFFLSKAIKENATEGDDNGQDGIATR